MIEQSLLACLQQAWSHGSKTENVKLSAMRMPTYHLIFVIMGRVKSQLFPQKLWTCSITHAKMWQFKIHSIFTWGYQKAGNGFILLHLLNDDKGMIEPSSCCSLQKKIRKRQIVGNANADLPPDFRHHRSILTATISTTTLNLWYPPAKM